jgi:dipeptide/tripeptide permease
MIAIVVYMVGLIILTVSALPQFLGGSFPLSGFIVGIILIAIGTGVIKSNVSAMAAEQVTLRTPEDASLEEKQVEQKVIERIFR